MRLRSIFMVSASLILAFSCETPEKPEKKQEEQKQEEKTEGDQGEEQETTENHDRDALLAIYNALDGPHWTNNTNWCSDKPLSEWYGVSVSDKGYVIFLELNGNGLSGVIPPEIGNLSQLEKLYLQVNAITGSIPPEIGRLQALKELEIWDNRLTGSIPEEIGNLSKLEVLQLFENADLTGPIPAKIGNLANMKRINLSFCKLTGNLPVELTKLQNLEGFFDCRRNPLSGKIPAGFADWKYWDNGWGYLVAGTNLDWSDAAPRCPAFSVSASDGTEITDSSVKEKELTILYQWASWCPFSPLIIPKLKSAMKHFGDGGLQVIGWTVDDSTSDARQFMADMDMSWPNFFATARNHIVTQELAPDVRWYPDGTIPSLTAFDKNGKMVYTSCTADIDYMETLVPFIAQWFGEPEWDGTDETFYESTDFSRDKHVTVLQEATEGNGIDLVFLGDGFSDRKIADGSYSAVVMDAMESWFSIEPYKTLRNMFNVKMIDVVSLNEGFGDGVNTALSTYWLGNTTVGGNDATVVEYVLRAVPEERFDDCVAVVLMNSSLYAGTASYFEPAKESDWCSGFSIAYFPAYTDYLAYLVRHEAGGHAFAKLADEYVLDEGRIDNESIQNTQRVTETYGWYKNVDFTDDPSLVRWRYFLEDERYAQEDVGIFEGAYYYGQGAFRPSFDSIMNSDREGGFNAVSREAIWYRAHKAAYGPDWEYSYEDFVAYDAVNRTSAASAQKKKEHRNFVEKELEPLSPPRMVNKTWRELLASPSTP